MRAPESVEAPAPAGSLARATRVFDPPPGRMTRGHRVTMGLAACLVPLLRPLLLATMRVRILGSAAARALIDAGRPFVGLVWHQYFLLAIELVRGRKVLFMTSRSRDGDISSRLLRRMGHGVVRGSSSAGGSSALRELTRFLGSGHGCVMVPDGPRGPARSAKPGCVQAARDAGAPILPFGCALSFAIRLKNWDRSAIPLPFCKAVLAYGEPIEVPRDASREDCEALLQSLERELNRLEKQCEAAL